MGSLGAKSGDDFSTMPNSARDRNEPYVQFPGRDIGMEYSGSDTLYWKVMTNQSNSKDLIDGMTSDERDAFEAWTEGHFMNGQQYRGWDNMRELDRRYTRVYDKILDQSELRENIVVRRAAGFELINNGSSSKMTLAQVQALKGQIIHSDGSMSFGAAETGLEIGYESKPVEYEVKFARGSKGAGMFVGDRRINGWNTRQREFMSNRDLAYKVGNSRYDADRDKIIVELTYFCRLPHKYGKKGK